MSLLLGWGFTLLQQACWPDDLRLACVPWFFANVLIFFVALRNGWSRQFSDPAMPTAQRASALILVRQDSLNSMPNRRHAMELLANEEQRALRQQAAPFVCMLDIDHFKRIHDTFGHAAGDNVLRLFAKNSSAVLRSIDVLTRWVGEEFLLLMPRTSMDEAPYASQLKGRNCTVVAPHDGGVVSDFRTFPTHLLTYLL